LYLAFSMLGYIGFLFSLSESCSDSF
jgi:hypothetical protein